MHSVSSDHELSELIEVIRSVTRTAETIEFDTPVISTGIVDSFDIAALLAAFESHFGASISATDLELEEFDTPRQMMKAIDGALA